MIIAIKPLLSKISLDLKKRVFFTLLIIVVYRIGVNIPIPGINIESIKFLFLKHQNNGILNILDIFSGGALRKMSIFSMGVVPYINSSIIINLIQGAHIVPYLDKLNREGEYGRKKINQIIKYLTLILGTVQAFILTLTMIKMSIRLYLPIVIDISFSWIFLSIITLVTGTMLIMWLGEQITEVGIGNGISIIIFAGIVEKTPRIFFRIIKLIQNKLLSLKYIFLLLVIMSIMFIILIWVETAYRKIYIHYVKKMSGEKLYNEDISFLPIKLEQSGVMAVIFATSILSTFIIIFQFVISRYNVLNFIIIKKFIKPIISNLVIYNIVYACLILFFCYFYNSISFDTIEIADNIRRLEGYVPNVRPGKQTSIYIYNVLKGITLWGAIFVIMIAIAPDYLSYIFNIPFLFNGTSLLIVIGVSLDVICQVESYIITKNYERYSILHTKKKKMVKI
ncbi:MAG: preprotein translocase subunit SecY [Endomicrobium sp.]|jgi:preprotein translocase subunit SecY|nr:preprotein translocase subunit SecY [Endomicrobium sp.]